MSGAAEQVFYPSCVVNLRVVFEHKMQIRVQNASGGYETQRLEAEENNGTIIMNRVPRKCSVTFKGHRHAATWKLTFDYKEIPIDPRTIVACVASIHLGTVTAENFATGIANAAQYGENQMPSILNTWTAAGVQDETNLLMLGPADEWTIDQGENGGEIHIEGRDIRGLLLDSPLVTPRDDPRHRGVLHPHGYRPPRPPPTSPGHHGRVSRRSSILQRLDCSRNIADLVRQILSEHDGLRQIPEALRPTVICDPNDWEHQTIPSPTEASHIPRHRRGASGGGSAPGGAGHSMNFWDIIVRYCFLVGAIPYFVGRHLHIKPARMLFQTLREQDRRTPFRQEGVENIQRYSEDGQESWGIRRLVYGRDVHSMKITRKYSGNNKPKTVRVVGIDQSSPHRGRHPQRLLEALWPPRNAREARADFLTKGNLRNAVGGQESHEILNIRVPGVNNMQQLVSIAQSIYEQVGRGEIKGNIQAVGLSSFGGSNADPDLLRMKPGDPIEMLVDASALNRDSVIVSTLNRTAQLSFVEAVEEVRRFLPDHNLARVIVASARGNVMGVLRYFYVSNVDIDWSDQEVTVKAEIQNYWTPRWDYVSDETVRNAQRHNARAGQHEHGQTASQEAANQTNPRNQHPGRRNHDNSSGTQPAAQGRRLQQITENAIGASGSYDVDMTRTVSESGEMRWRRPF